MEEIPGSGQAFYQSMVDGMELDPGARLRLQHAVTRELWQAYPQTGASDVRDTLLGASSPDDFALQWRHYRSSVGHHSEIHAFLGMLLDPRRTAYLLHEVSLLREGDQRSHWAGTLLDLEPTHPHIRLLIELDDAQLDDATWAWVMCLDFHRLQGRSPSNQVQEWYRNLDHARVSGETMVDLAQVLAQTSFTPSQEETYLRLVLDGTPAALARDIAQTLC